VKYIVQTLLNLLLFVMPVILTADSVFLALRKHHLTYLFRIYMLNPVAAIITAFREVLLPRIALEALDPKDPTLKHVPPPSVGWPIYLAGAVMCVGIAWSGYAYFNARKWQFVERF
jgi:ABC-type polysaccharide/polyol phosphate export permease